MLCSLVPLQGYQWLNVPIKSMSSREFDHDTSRANKSTDVDPVFITDRGQLTLADALAQDKGEAIEFEPSHLSAQTAPISRQNADGN
jgi:hypothetical protein